MNHYEYRSYQHYLDVQYRTNIDRKFITHLKFDLRAEDIQHIKSVFQGRRCLCVGCREDTEVDDFVKSGFEAVGIDKRLNSVAQGRSSQPVWREGRAAVGMDESGPGATRPNVGLHVSRRRVRCGDNVGDTAARMAQRRLSRNCPA